MTLERNPAKTRVALAAVFLVALAVRAGALIALSAPLPEIRAGH